MGSGNNKLKNKQQDKTLTSQNNYKSNGSESIENVFQGVYPRKHLNEIQKMQRIENQTNSRSNIENNLKGQNSLSDIDNEESNLIKQQKKIEEINQILKGGQLEYLIHLLENNDLDLDDPLDEFSNKVIHLICKYNKHRLLKYLIFHISEVSYNVLSQVVFHSKNINEQTVLDICIQSNSIDCLKILFKVGGFSLDNKYKKYICLALSYNSQNSHQYLIEKTRDGVVLDFKQINYQYINRFTINYFKEFLQFQSRNISYKEIHTSLFISYKFIDPSFLHIPQNIYGVNFNQNQHKDKQTVWLQPEDICRYNQAENFYSFQNNNKYVLFEQISPANIIQGQSMNCYFLAVLQSLCLNPQLIKSIFDLQQSKPEVGLYICKFYSNGYAENIIIDHYLPCNKNNKQLIYSKFYKNAIWVALLEKAWAKMNGSYFDAEQLLIEDAMENIFPYPTEGFWIKDFTKQELLSILQKGVKNNYIIVVTTKVDLKDENISLIQNHAYSFLSLYNYKGQNIIKLKNPWGKNEWKGKLQKQETQKVKELKQALGNYVDDEKDGILNMTLKEFQQYFAYVCIQYFEAGYIYSAIKIQLKNRKAKYYKFQLKYKTKLCLRLIQTTKKDLSCQKIEFRLFKISADEVSQIFYNGQDCWESNRVTYIQSKSSFVDLDKGDYVIKVKIYKDEKIKDDFEEVVLSTYSSINLKLELLNRSEGKEVNNNFIKYFFNNIKPIQVSTYGVVQEGWDKYYRYLLKIQNKGKQSITYLSNISLKSNLMISNPEIKIINKTSFKVDLQPNQIKLIKFKIKKPIKKAKILISHQFE
ncbi:hypothetical protein ABPG74_005644 [Tetrahymena malaccensis]